MSSKKLSLAFGSLLTLLALVDCSSGHNAPLNELAGLDDVARKNACDVLTADKGSGGSATVEDIAFFAATGNPALRPHPSQSQGCQTAIQHVQQMIASFGENTDRVHNGFSSDQEVVYLKRSQYKAALDDLSKFCDSKEMNVVTWTQEESDARKTGCRLITEDSAKMLEKYCSISPVYGKASQDPRMQCVTREGLPNNEAHVR